MYYLAPSELDYKAKKCKRCFYIHKKDKISSGNFPPPVFSSFDVCQTNYFKSKNCSDLTDQLPEGRFMTSNELPGKISSIEMQDNKKRSFILQGKPDIVIKFEKEGYGIIDFKTTNLKDTKSESYKYQLEAYAQIFTNPGGTKTAKTPKLTPITHMGIMQFYPTEIFEHRDNECDLRMKTQYSPLKRDEKDFLNHITNIIDLLEENKVPDFNPSCNECSFVIKQNSLGNIDFENSNELYTDVLFETAKVKAFRKKNGGGKKKEEKNKIEELNKDK